MYKSFSPCHFLKYCVVAIGLLQAGVFSPQAHAVLTVPTRPTSFPLSPVSYTNQGTPVVWGDTNWGQTSVPAGLSNNVVQVAVGGPVALALKSDKTVAVWGNSSAYYYTTQTNIPLGLTNVIQVAAGGNFCLALKGDGTVVSWGGVAAYPMYNYYITNNYGQTNVPAGLTNVVQVAVGQNFSLALKSDGRVVAWGDSSYGQTNVPANLTNAVQVAAGADTALALRSDGTVTAWGSNGNGQTNVPAGLTNAVQVTGGYAQSAALKADGTVVAWGYDYFGQGASYPSVGNAVQIAAAGYGNYALRSIQTVYYSGAIFTPGAPPAGLTNVVQVAASLTTSVAAAIVGSSSSSQTIGAFTTIPTKMYGSAPFTVTAPIATSGLPVTLSVVSGPATILGNTVTLTGVGTVVLAANQAGNGSYSAAPQVTTSFQVNMGSQTIAKFSNIADQKKKTSFALNVPLASSGLTVTVKVRSGPATIANNRVTTTGPGIVVLEASQSGNSNYTAAVPVTCKFVVK